MELSKKLNSPFSVLFSFCRSKKFLSTLCSFLFLLLVSFYSGYALTNSYEFQTAFNVILVLSGGLLLVSFILLVKIPDETKSIKNILVFYLKRIKFDLPLFYLFYFIFIAALSIIVNKDFNASALKSYVSIVFIYVFAYSFVKLFSFKTFIQNYKKIFPWICVISIFFFAVLNIFDIKTIFNTFTTSTSVYENYLFIYMNSVSLRYRNSGFFWEPALFGIFICIALILEIAEKNKKPRVFAILIYMLTLITTLSSSAIVLTIISLILSFLLKRNEMKKYFYVGVIICAIIGVAFIIVMIALPDVWMKLFNAGGGSFKTRYISPYINFRMMLDHPFGVGYTKEYSIFLQYCVNLGFKDVDVQTCSFGYWMGAYGFLGLGLFIAPIVFLFFTKKLQVWDKIIITVLFILFSMTEPIQTNLCCTIFIFYVLEDFNFKGKKVEAGDNSSSIIARLLRNEKTSIFLKNSLGTFIVKGLALLISLLTTSAYINYFADPKGEGLLSIWFTILSILTWILAFDLGVGNGLKNKLVESFEKNDEQRIKKLISSAYISSSIVSLLILIVCVSLIWTTDVASFFSLKEGIVSIYTLRVSLTIIIVGICLNFVLKLIGNIFEARQKQGLSNFFSLCNSVILLIYTMTFTFNNDSSKLIGISVAYLIASTVPLLFASIIVFNTKYKKYAISFKSFDIATSKDVMLLGGYFFVIQIFILLINSTNTFLIQYFFSDSQPGAASEFTYYSKIYNIPIMISQLLGGPLWVIVTKAKTTGDKIYVEKLNKFLFFLIGAFTLFNLLVFAFLPIIFNVWIPNAQFEFNWVINAIFAVGSIVVTATSLFSVISNGLSKLKFQMIGFGVGLILKVVILVVCIWMLKSGKNISWAVIELSTAIAYICPMILLLVTNNKYISQIA